MHTTVINIWKRLLLKMAAIFTMQSLLLLLVVFFFVYAPLNTASLTQYLH